jgi:hypothetical protein
MGLSSWFPTFLYFNCRFFQFAKVGNRFGINFLFFSLFPSEHFEYHFLALKIHQIYVQKLNLCLSGLSRPNLQILFGWLYEFMLLIM